MKRTVQFIAVILIFMSVSGSATTVELTADKENVTIGESIKLHLEIHPTEPVGGQFVLYREVEPRRYKLCVVFYEKPSPEQCTECAGDFPLSEDLSRNFHYKPTEVGNYYAEANFGGARDKVYFTVFSETTTTTTPTTTTTITTTTTTTPTTTTTITTTTTTTTSVATTSTLPEENSSPVGSSHLLLLAIPVAIFLVMVAVIVLYLWWRSK